MNNEVEIEELDKNMREAKRIGNNLKEKGPTSLLCEMSLWNGIFTKITSLTLQTEPL